MRGLGRGQSEGLQGIWLLPAVPHLCPLPEALGYGNIPPRMRDIQHHAVRSSPLHLEVARTPGTHGVVKPFLLSDARALGLLQLGARLLESIHLKADVVDTAVVRPVRSYIGVFFFRLPVQDGQVDVAIGQEHCTVWTAADLL